MSELQQYLELMLKASITKMIISNPATKSEEYKKIIIENKGKTYQVSKYTEKQVFHENVTADGLLNRCMELIQGHYRQVNAISNIEEHIVLISKKGNCNYKVKKTATDQVVLSQKQTGHNRKKNYILQEGMNIAPLVDMGVFTKDGKVVNSMYDKYKQINRFIEIIDDEVSDLNVDTLNVIDFGCGKSYLTFVVYFYLTEVMHIKVNMIGLDLKEDVIRKCNEAAQKYNYQGLKFEVGDVNGFKAPFDVDMVITLHACDTATDFALYNAILWNAKMIFSVPCCQHELNRQIKPEDMTILSRYGIIKERFSALATDAIRGNILEYCGYKTQLLEFIDFDHTPKNILIRAVRRPIIPKKVRDKLLQEVEIMRKEFAFEPTLYHLLKLDPHTTTKEIRLTQPAEIDKVMDIYARARKFMAEHDNPNQWGNNKPSREQIENDILSGKSYVCVEDGQIAAVFYFAHETDPTYEKIYDGNWQNEEPYAVVHRIASSGIVKGAGSFCMQWAASQSKNVRIDTHENNYVMQNMLKKNGFVQCGTIFLEDGEPRLAFHRVGESK